MLMVAVDARADAKGAAGVAEAAAVGGCRTHLLLPPLRMLLQCCLMLYAMVSCIPEVMMLNPSGDSSTGEGHFSMWVLNAGKVMKKLSTANFVPAIARSVGMPMTFVSITCVCG